MLGRHRKSLVFVALGLAALAPVAAALPLTSGPPVPAPVGELAGVCDPIDPAHCLLPFPNDFFTVADPTTDTGRRVNISPLAGPTNVAGQPWDSGEWNRQDGFSPGALILTRVPGLDLGKTWGMPAEQITDLARSVEPDAPIVLLDADTGERHPFWSELDTHPETTDADRLLMVRPARNLAEGHRYLVALRRLRDGSGNLLDAGPAFAALRDGTAAPATSPAVDGRRTAIGKVLADLEHAGITRDDLYLAWDFTVASERNLSERVLTMRDDAFAQLGDTDLDDQQIQGISPQFTITSVTDRTPAASRGTSRTVKGTITVPNYLTPQVTPVVSLPAEVRDVLEQVDDQAPSPVDTATGLLTEETLSMTVPGSRLLQGPDGLPVQNPAQPTVEVDFDCHLPHQANVPAPDGLADPLIYGHGLLGDRGEAGGGSTEDMRLRGFAVCAVDWWGMSTNDLANVALILTDMSRFPSLADRSQQGFVNWLYLTRALAHPAGFAAHPAFQDESGHPLLRTGSVAYDGNSQGGIMGGALTALAPDLTRAKLGVPGMNYSTLLNRSVDWEGQYALIAYAVYPSKIDQQLVFALVQMLWDRAEANGYALHMTDDPLANTPAHQVMLQVAYGDHQVANITAEVEARTIGARLEWPALGADSPHWSVDMLYGLEPALYGEASAGQSVLAYWYSADRGIDQPPPNGNLPPTAGEDPHEDPRRDNLASDQLAHWFRTGLFLDACSASPCVTTTASRSNG